MHTDDHRPRRLGARPYVRQRHHRVCRRAVGAALDHHRHESRGAHPREASIDDRKVWLLPTPGTERGGRGEQPGRDLDRGSRRRGETQRRAADVRLPDGAAHHAQEHRAQHVARSDLRPARIDPHRRARHAEPHGCQRRPRTEAETGREAGQQAPPRRRCRGLRRGRASLAPARYAARLDQSRGRPQAAQGGHGSPGCDLPREDSAAGVAGVGGAVRRGPPTGPNLSGRRWPPIAPRGARRWRR